MPIKTGDLLEPIDSDGLVINAGLQADDNDGYNSYNPIRGLYHVNGNFALLDNGGVDAPAYLHNNFAPPLNQMIRGALVTIKDNNTSNGPTTYYQALNGVDSDVVYNNGNPYSIFEQDVEDMAYNWQLRTNFHEFCMQYDKYPPIDEEHFNNYPEQYQFCVWRQDKREFQSLAPSFVMGQIVGDFVNNYQFRETLNPDASAVAFDANGDGTVSTADLIEFLTAFGNSGTYNIPSTCSVYFDDDIPVLDTEDVWGSLADDPSVIGLQPFPASVGRPKWVGDASFFRWPSNPAHVTIDTSDNENLYGFSAFSVNKATTPALEKDYIRFSGPSFQTQSNLTAKVCKVTANVTTGGISHVYVPVYIVLDTTVHYANGTSKVYRGSNRPYVAPDYQTTSTFLGTVFYNHPVFQSYTDDNVLVEDEIVPSYDFSTPPFVEAGPSQTVNTRMLVGAPKTEVGTWPGAQFYDDHFKYTVQSSDPSTSGIETSVFQLWPSEEVQHVDISVGVYTQHGDQLQDVTLNSLRFEWYSPQYYNQ